jgi:DNA-binding IclR family transcriptional regulator
MASHAPDTPLSRKSEAPLQTLARGLRILRFIGASPGLVRLRDVAHAFELERSVALRILQSLEAEGFLKKHEPLKAYSLGPALETLTKPRSLVERLSERARPFLERLTNETGQTAHVGILEDDRAVLVEVLMASGPVVVQQSPGDLEHLYCSAIGKVIYAFLPEKERRRIARRMVFERYKPATLKSVEALDAECVEIRREGIAFDRDEGPAPLACIAAPILDEHDYPVASVGISTISALIKKPIDKHRAWIRVVKNCAQRLQADLRQ